MTRPSSAAEDNVSLSAADFKAAVARKDFAFWWEAHGHLYGLPASLNEDIAAHRTVICNVSRAAVDSLILHYLHVLSILVTAPPETWQHELVVELAPVIVPPPCG